MSRVPRSVTVAPVTSLESDCLRLLLRSSGIPVTREPDAGTAAVVLALTRRRPLAAPASAIRMPPTGPAPLLVVTDSVDSKAVALARSLRAAGLVSWHSPTDVVVEAVRTVVGGGRLPLAIGGQLNLDPLVQLTSRERDVIALVALGEQDEDIAEWLGITVGTVRTHVQQLLRKLGAPHRHAAAAVARQSPVMVGRLRRWSEQAQAVAG